jgi:hypothetical protein
LLPFILPYPSYLSLKPLYLKGFQAFSVNRVPSHSTRIYMHLGVFLGVYRQLINSIPPNNLIYTFGL